MTTHHPQPDSSEQDARIRREHAAMLEFIARLASLDTELKYTDTYYIGRADALEHVKLHAQRVLAAIDTPDAVNTPLQEYEAKEAFYASLTPVIPPAAASAANGLPASGNAGGTKYYAAPYFELDKGVSIQRNGIFYVAPDGELLWDSAESIEAAQAECDRLNAADTVAGSGNAGGE